VNDFDIAARGLCRVAVAYPVARHVVDRTTDSADAGPNGAEFRRSELRAAVRSTRENAVIGFTGRY
jgi:hypothetical protein